MADRTTFRRIVWFFLALSQALMTTQAWAIGDSYFPVHKVNSGQAVLIMRHALAPGTGDPAEFVLGDCGTQRNLSEAGRQQARLAGDTLRGLGLEAAIVFTSQWCRCRETAEGLSLGSVQALPALNSFFQQWDREVMQTRELLEWLEKGRPLNKAVMLVTHQVNITALTGVYPRSGEILVIEPEPGDGSSWRVIYRIQIPVS